MNIEKLIKVVKLTKHTRVGDSPASDIVREIKAKYPQVKITQFSKPRKYPDGSTAHVTELEFSGYPGDNATGFSNDPRTGSRDNWEKFLKYLYQKYVPGADRFKASIAVGPSTVRIIQDSVKDVDFYTYEFPKFTAEDRSQARRYGLEIIRETSQDTIVRGDLKKIKEFADNYLGYQLNKDYLSKDSVKDENSFKYRGILVIKSSYGWKFIVKGQQYECATDKEAIEKIDELLR